MQFKSTPVDAVQSMQSCQWSSVDALQSMHSSQCILVNALQPMKSSQYTRNLVDRIQLTENDNGHHSRELHKGTACNGRELNRYKLKILSKKSNLQFFFKLYYILIFDLIFLLFLIISSKNIII